MSAVHESVNGRVPYFTVVAWDQPVFGNPVAILRSVKDKHQFAAVEVNAEVLREFLEEFDQSRPLS